MRKNIKENPSNKKTTISVLPRFKDPKQLYPEIQRDILDNKDILMSTERPAMYTFSRSKKKASFIPTTSTNEKRFSYNPNDSYLDSYYITHRKYYILTCSTGRIIDFSKNSSRDFKAFKCNLGSSAAEIKTKLIGTVHIPSGVPFSKMLSRNFDFRNNQNANQIPLNINKLLGRLSNQKRILTPNFNMFKSRYMEGQQLPSFMQNLNNRLAITKLSYEMLKSNRYSDIKDMKPVYTSFGSKRSFHMENKRPLTGSIDFLSYSPEKPKPNQKKKFVFIDRFE